jgi:hypothetical protein
VVRVDLVARITMHADRDFVADSAGGQESRRLLTEQFRDTTTQFVDGWIKKALFIAHRCIGNGFAHRRRGTRLSVAVEINAAFYHVGSFAHGE